MTIKVPLGYQQMPIKSKARGPLPLDEWLNNGFFNDANNGAAITENELIEKYSRVSTYYNLPVEGIPEKVKEKIAILISSRKLCQIRFKKEIYYVRSDYLIAGKEIRIWGRDTILRKQAFATKYLPSILRKRKINRRCKKAMSLI